jgi:hypothetical protein
MAGERKNPPLGSDVERILWHPTQRRILLGCAAGPTSPAELSKSRIGKGIRLESFSYHFKELHRLGMLQVAAQGFDDDRSVTRYRLTARLSQAEIDAAALKAISDVLASISEPLVKWIDQPFLEEIGDLVDAAGHRH